METSEEIWRGHSTLPQSRKVFAMRNTKVHEKGRCILHPVPSWSALSLLC
jgi:hypothetical protein